MTIFNRNYPSVDWDDDSLEDLDDDFDGIDINDSNLALLHDYASDHLAKGVYEKIHYHIKKYNKYKDDVSEYKSLYMLKQILLAYLRMLPLNELR